MFSQSIIRIKSKKLWLQEKAFCGKQLPRGITIRKIRDQRDWITLFHRTPNCHLQKYDHKNPLHSLPFHRKRIRTDNDKRITKQRPQPYSQGEEILHLIKTQKIYGSFNGESKKQNQEDPEIELLFFFNKFTASKHESLITKKNREEQRDK